jgi:hypothetical protein
MSPFFNRASSPSTARVYCDRDGVANLEKFHSQAHYRRVFRYAFDLFYSRATSSIGRSLWRSGGFVISVLVSFIVADRFSF